MLCLFLNRCNQSGVAYVAFSQWIAVLVIYTFVYHMLEPPEEYYELVSDEGEDSSVKGGTAALAALEADSMPSVTSAEWPDVKDAATEDSRTPLLARVFRYPSLTSQTSGGEEVLHNSLTVNNFHLWSLVAYECYLCRS